MNATTSDRSNRMLRRAISALVAVLLAEALFAGWSLVSADLEMRKTLLCDVSGGEAPELLVVRNLSEVMSELRRLEYSATAGGLSLVSGLFGLLFILMHWFQAKLAAQKKALRDSEKRYILLAEKSRTFDWEIDAKGQYTYVSHVVRGVIGFRPDELVGKKYFYDLHPADHRAAFKNEAFRTIARREPFLRLNNQIVSKDGRLVWVSTSGLPIFDAQGNLQGYRGSDTDVTERTLKESELRESECRMRVFIDSAREALLKKAPAAAPPPELSGNTPA